MKSIRKSDILGRKILFVTAHPDDESYLAAGTMLQNHRAGGESLVACATFGERGKSHFKKSVTSLQLKAIRKKELLAVSKFLKVSKLLMPGLPDTRLGEKKEIFLKKLRSFAEKNRPDLMISFGKDGISGHLDHVSAGAVARTVAKELKIPFLVFSAPPSFASSIRSIKDRRKHGRYIRQLEHKPHNIKIKVDRRSKLRALRLHKSQLDQGEPFSGLSARVAEEFLNAEYFSDRE